MSRSSRSTRPSRSGGAGSHPRCKRCRRTAAECSAGPGARRGRPERTARGSSRRRGTASGSRHGAGRPGRSPLLLRAVGRLLRRLQADVQLGRVRTDGVLGALELQPGNACWRVSGSQAAQLRILRRSGLSMVRGRLGGHDVGPSLGPPTNEEQARTREVCRSTPPAGERHGTARYRDGHKPRNLYGAPAVGSPGCRGFAVVDPITASSQVPTTV